MGPVCAVLLDRKLGFEEFALLDRFLESVAKGVIEKNATTRDLWIDGSKLLKFRKEGSNCQFSVWGDNALTEMDAEEIAQLEAVLGQQVQFQVIVSAGCKSDGDHNVLGELILEIALVLRGMIDFGGCLSWYTSDPAHTLEGKVYKIYSDDGDESSEVFDASLMRSWLQHPDFRMVK